MKSSEDASSSRPSLDAPLDPEQFRRTRWGMVGYQAYPVFSWRWLRGRTALFATVFGVCGGFVAFAYWSEGNALRETLVLAIAFVAGLMGIATSGPLLATWCREKVTSESSLRWMIPAALLAGVLLSFGIDHIASSTIEALLPHKDGPAPEPEPAVLVLNILLLMAVYGVAGGGLSYLGFRKERRARRELVQAQELHTLREQKQVLDLRMSALQAQLEPHFLFNALASVRALVVDEPKEGLAALDALTDYLRATVPRLSGNGGVQSTLGDQVEHCENYLRLMSLRLGRLRCSVSIDDALRDVPFPPLVLHTLVENAIQHGVEPKAGETSIELRLTCSGNVATVLVRDDGAGLRPDSRGTGVGLKNVREQLRLRYGEAASLRLQSRSTGGVDASIRFPWAEDTTADGAEEAG